MKRHSHTVIANCLLALNNPIQSKKIVVLITLIQCQSTKFQILTFVFFFLQGKPAFVVLTFPSPGTYNYNIALIKCLYIHLEREQDSFGTVVWPGFDSNMTTT